MTEEELKAAITVFRMEVEDIVPLIVLKYYFKGGAIGVTYVDEADVLATIPLAERQPYMTVNIDGEEYWFLPDLTTLANKLTYLTILDGTITLAKMADMPSGTLIYRRSAGTGVPEVQTLAQLKTDLNIPSSVDLSGLVEKVTGYGLFPIAWLPFIHEPGSDDQDLSGLVEKVTGYSLISDAEIARLALIKQNVYKIELPAGTSITERLAGTVVKPTGWTLAADGPTGGNLKITHDLTDRGIVTVSVKATDLTGTRVLVPFRDAYSGLLEDGLDLTIEGLAINDLPLTIALIFD